MNVKEIIRCTVPPPYPLARHPGIWVSTDTEPAAGGPLAGINPKYNNGGQGETNGDRILVHRSVRLPPSSCSIPPCLWHTAVAPIFTVQHWTFRAATRCGSTPETASSSTLRTIRNHLTNCVPLRKARHAPAQPMIRNPWAIEPFSCGTLYGVGAKPTSALAVTPFMNGCAPPFRECTSPPFIRRKSHKCSGTWGCTLWNVRENAVLLPMVCPPPSFNWAHGREV